MDKLKKVAGKMFGIKETQGEHDQPLEITIANLGESTMRVAIENNRIETIRYWESNASVKHNVDDALAD
jgi:hypothetical protein